MKTLLSRFRRFLWYFGHFQVPMIGYARPKLLTLDDDSVVVKLPLSRRNKNHLHSMYFGALCVGADLVGGLHGFYHAKKAAVEVSLAFKSFQAQFLKRPESDVYFVNQQGQVIKDMIQQALASGERVNKILPLQAYTHYLTNKELVAEFQIELSLKVVS